MPLDAAGASAFSRTRSALRSICGSLKMHTQVMHLKIHTHQPEDMHSTDAPQDSQKI